MLSVGDGKRLGSSPGDKVGACTQISIDAAQTPVL